MYQSIKWFQTNMFSTSFNQIRSTIPPCHGHHYIFISVNQYIKCTYKIILLKSVCLIWFFLQSSTSSSGKNDTLAVIWRRIDWICFIVFCCITLALRIVLDMRKNYMERQISYSSGGTFSAIGRPFSPFTSILKFHLSNTSKVSLDLITITSLLIVLLLNHSANFIRACFQQGYKQKIIPCNCWTIVLIYAVSSGLVDISTFIPYLVVILKSSIGYNPRW